MCTTCSMFLNLNCADNQIIAESSMAIPIIYLMQDAQHAEFY